MVRPAEGPPCWIFPRQLRLNKSGGVWLRFHLSTLTCRARLLLKRAALQSPPLGGRPVITYISSHQAHQIAWGLSPVPWSCIMTWTPSAQIQQLLHFVSQMMERLMKGTWHGKRSSMLHNTPSCTHQPIYHHDSWLNGYSLDLGLCKHTCHLCVVHSFLPKKFPWVVIAFLLCFFLGVQVSGCFVQENFFDTYC